MSHVVSHTCMTHSLFVIRKNPLESTRSRSTLYIRRAFALPSREQQVQQFSHYNKYDSPHATPLYLYHLTELTVSFLHILVPIQ